MKRSPPVTAWTRAAHDWRPLPPAPQLPQEIEEAVDKTFQRPKTQDWYVTPYSLRFADNAELSRRRVAEEKAYVDALNAQVWQQGKGADPTLDA